MHKRVLVESLRRVVLQEVAGHRFHELDDLCPRPVVAEDHFNFRLEFRVVQQPLKQAVMVFFQGLDQLLEDLKFLEAQLLVVLIRQELVIGRQEVLEQAEIAKSVEVKPATLSDLRCPASRKLVLDEYRRHVMIAAILVSLCALVSQLARRLVNQLLVVILYQLSGEA